VHVVLTVHEIEGYMQGKQTKHWTCLNNTVQLHLLLKYIYMQSFWLGQLPSEKYQV